MVGGDAGEWPGSELTVGAHRFQAHNAVQPGSVYVTRPADHRYQAALLAGEDCHLLGSRMSGKSSMLRRAARDLGDRISFVYVDLTSVMTDETTSGVQWMTSVLFAACRAVDDRTRWDAWRERWARSPVIGDMFSAIVDAAPEGRPLCLQLDEFDKLRAYSARDAAGELLAGLRTLKDSTPSLAGRLILSTSSVLMPSRMLEYREQFPTELPGTYVRLEDFTPDDQTVGRFADGFPPGHPAARSFARAALTFSGGYPQLATFLCRRMIDERLAPDIDPLHWLAGEVERLRRAPIEEKDFLDTCDRFLTQQPRDRHRDAVYAYRQVLTGDWYPFDSRDQSAELLRQAGLVAVRGDYIVKRCEFLARYYDEAWASRRLLHLAERAVAPPVPRPRRYHARVGILHTGGTIGMLERADGTVQTPDDIDELRAEFAEVNDLVAADWYTIMTVDSANVGPNEWTAIAEAIHDRMQDYDGFVVAHGTDTLAFSASAVAFALGERLSFPVVFTGAQTTPDVRHGDARSNLLRSCLVAAQGIKLPEVVICFDEFVYRAVRCSKRDDRRFSAFESPTYPPLGVVTEDVELQSGVIRELPQTPGRIELTARFSAGILVVAQTPGTRSSFFEAALDQEDAYIDADGNRRTRRRCRGVILQSLGAGNIPTTPAHSLVPLIAAARARDVPVVLTSLYPVHTRNLARYSPVLAAIEAGAIAVANMTTAAAVAKFSWVLAQAEALFGDGDPRAGSTTAFVADRMRADCVGELGELEIPTP